MSKIHIKFVCPYCENDKLLEVVTGIGDPDFNEFPNLSKKEEYKDEIAYLCTTCHQVNEPMCIDFNLKEEKNA
jgi:hypothetical protein